MTEWGVVLVIIALIGLVATIMGPVVYVVRTLAKLTVTIETLQKELIQERNQAIQTHQKLWNRLDEHSEALHDHDKRIYSLEQAVNEF